jgi:hypothetical protein
MTALKMQSTRRKVVMLHELCNESGGTWEPRSCVVVPINAPIQIEAEMQKDRMLCAELGADMIADCQLDYLPDYSRCCPHRVSRMRQSKSSCSWMRQRGSISNGMPDRWEMEESPPRVNKGKSGAKRSRSWLVIHGWWYRRWRVPTRIGGGRQNRLMSDGQRSLTGGDRPLIGIPHSNRIEGIITLCYSSNTDNAPLDTNEILSLFTLTFGLSNSGGVTFGPLLRLHRFPAHWFPYTCSDTESRTSRQTATVTQIPIDGIDVSARDRRPDLDLLK